jgi:RNA polymerase sigma-70 factor (ECF subfamily)
MRSNFEQVIPLLKRGGDQALEKALTLVQKSVFAFSMRVCGRHQDAEDTMQDVLVKSLPYLTKFESSRALAFWLYRVARNSCLMSRRKSKFAPKAELSLEELMPDRKDFERLDGRSILSPEAAAVRHEQDLQLRQALRILPPHYRIVLVLRDMEGLTDEEVAEITGLRPGTVRVRLHRARLFVRKELARGNLAKERRLTSARQPGAGAASERARCKKLFAELSDYLDGQLDDFSCEEMEKHLSRCQPCEKLLRSLKVTIERCQHLPAQCPDRKHAAELRKKLLATYSRALANSGPRSAGS